MGLKKPQGKPKFRSSKDQNNNVDLSKGNQTVWSFVKGKDLSREGQLLFSADMALRIRKLREGSRIGGH